MLGELLSISKFGTYITKVGEQKRLSRQLGIGVTSVFRYLRTSTFPEPQGRRSRDRSILVPYQKHILQRWNSGCHEGLVLFEEIKTQGYKGSYDTVARYTRRIRTAQGIQPRKLYSIKSLPKVTQRKKTLSDTSLKCSMAGAEETGVATAIR